MGMQKALIYCLLRRNFECFEQVVIPKHELCHQTGLVLMNRLLWYPRKSFNPFKMISMETCPGNDANVIISRWKMFKISVQVSLEWNVANYYSSSLCSLKGLRGSGEIILRIILIQLGSLVVHSTEGGHVHVAEARFFQGVSFGIKRGNDSAINTASH